MAESAKIVGWNKRKIENNMIYTVSYDSLMSTDGVDSTQIIINSLHRLGVAIVDKVPSTGVDDTTALALGRLFDTIDELTSTTQGFTFCPIRPCTIDGGGSNTFHTHQTYLPEPAGLQAIHYVRGATETPLHLRLVDGFNVVRRLQRRNPGAYERLCAFQVPAVFTSESNKKYWHSAPIITLNASTRRPKQIRYVQIVGVCYNLQFFF